MPSIAIFNVCRCLLSSASSFCSSALSFGAGLAPANLVAPQRVAEPSAPGPVQRRKELAQERCAPHLSSGKIRQPASGNAERQSPLRWEKGRTVWEASCDAEEVVLLDQVESSTREQGERVDVATRCLSEGVKGVRGKGRTSQEESDPSREVQTQLLLRGSARMLNQVLIQNPTRCTLYDQVNDSDAAAAAGVSTGVGWKGQCGVGANMPTVVQWTVCGVERRMEGGAILGKNGAYYRSCKVEPDVVETDLFFAFGVFLKVLNQNPPSKMSSGQSDLKNISKRSRRGSKLLGPEVKT
ncbi:hypothetical protein BDK51DRAFT_26796 [Blyttiomyces helicus]|uniref:Uncharacterized protein n=1 Tax=Blyttiomyces helicus TaxID=388810 RepID=A0A4P9WMJ5_9FUNG|nr:hypothetical protein BDK51DRAFT_26796 [Blyttiomyces helicus]|eukprot:RKO94134.1 hypothetical protein BDK51DRAFT_26796 [Blyttiomyces helicus]